MAALAVPWFVLTTTGSAARTGVTAAAAIVPTALAGFVGGPFVDRIGFKRASIGADLVSALSVALIPLLHVTVGLQFWQLLVLVVVGGLFDAPGTSARYSLIPNAVTLAGTSLDRAMSAKDAASRVSGLFGPAIAGVLIAVIGPTNVLWVDAGSFVVSALIVAFAVPDEAVERDTTAPTRYLDDLGEGWRYLRSDRVLLGLIVTATVTNCLDAAVGSVVVPVYVRAVFDNAAALGVLGSALGLGSLLGIVGYGVVSGRLSRRSTYTIGVLLLSLRPWLFTARLPLVVLVAACTLLGLAAGPMNPIYGAVFFERVPAHLRGRVMSLDLGLSFVAMPVGVLAAGVLIEAVGLRTTSVAIGTAFVITALTFAASRRYRDMERPPT